MLASPTTNSKLERIDGGNKKYSGEIERGSEGPGEDLGIEILADVEGGSVDGLRPELFLVRPEFGLLCGSACPRHRDSALGFRRHGKVKENRGERWVRTDWMVDWSGCGGARSALTPALMPKRRASWVSLISLFMPPLAIVAAAAASLSFRCCCSFLSLPGRKA